MLLLIKAFEFDNEQRKIMKVAGNDIYLEKNTTLNAFCSEMVREIAGNLSEKSLNPNWSRISWPLHFTYGSFQKLLLR